MNILKRLNDDQKIGIYFALSLIIRSINITLNEIFLLNSSYQLFVQIIVAFSYFILDLVAFFHLKGKNKVLFLFFETIGFLLLFFTMIRYNSIGYNIFISYSWLILSFIPIVFLFCFIKKYEDVIHVLYKSSYIITFLCSLIFFFHVRSISTNMVFSYTLLIPIVIQYIYIYKSNRRFIVGTIILLESIMLLLYGARGTLVCYLIFIFLYFYYCLSKKKKKIFLTIILGFIFTLFILYYAGIFRLLYNEFLNYGKYIRLLDMLSTGNFFDNNGRFEIYAHYLKMIIEKPILGWGVGADLIVGIFPHNVIIEIFFNFGIIIGFIILLTIVSLTIHSYISENKKYLLFFLSTGVLPLFFSFSYLEWMPFWMFIGFIFNANKRRIINITDKLKMRFLLKKVI